MARSSPVLISTTAQIEGRSVTAYLGIVSTHVVAGTGLFSDWAASFSDVFGGRSGSYARQLEAINTEALAQLQQRAAARGANAIVGVSIDHDEVSGGGKSMFMVTAAGTAVVLAQDESGTASSAIPGKNVRDRAWLIHLMQQFEQGEVPTGEEMQRIVASRDPAFAPLLLGLAGLPLDRRPANLFATPTTPGVLAAYFEGLPPEDAQEAIYQAIADPKTTAAVRQQYVRLITDLSLVSLGHSQRILESGPIDGRTCVLPSLRHTLHQYEADDLERLDVLAQTVVRAFPDIATDVEKRGLMGTKTAWVCGYCSHENVESAAHCLHCDRDRRGLLRTQPSPESVARSLRLFRDALAHELGTAKAP